jgi:hypothetical protein
MTFRHQTRAVSARIQHRFLAAGPGSLPGSYDRRRAMKNAHCPPLAPTEGNWSMSPTSCRCAPGRNCSSRRMVAASCLVSPAGRLAARPWISQPGSRTGGS